MSDLFVPEIHFIADFAGSLDRARLARAMRLLLDAEPVCGCRFVPRWIAPYWVRLSETALDNAPVLRAGDEGSQHSFLAEVIDEHRGPQVAALLIPRATGDRLLVKVKHMVADAGGTKQLAYRLASIYRALTDDPGYRPTPNLGSRSLRQVYRLFGWRDVWPMLRVHHRANWRNMVPWDSLQFPATIDRSGSPAFVFHRFGPDRVRAMRVFAAPVGATLNDLLVTATFRALIRVTGWRPGGPTPRLLCTVDLRRYLPPGEVPGLCNLSTFFFPHLPEGPGDDFATTLSRVQKHVDDEKSDYFGVGYMFGGLVTLIGSPFVLTRWVCRKLFHALLHSRNAAPVLTNLGPVDVEKIAFGAPAVAAAEVVVPLSFPPSLSIGVSGYGDTLTLSCGFVDSGFGREKIVALFAAIDDELPR